MKSILQLTLVFSLALLLISFSANAQTVHQVGAGENTLYDAVQLAVDGDILELYSDGGLYTYSLSDKIEILKTLTIRAAEGLNNKPIIRTITNTSNTRHFEVKTGGNLTLIGLDLDGRAVDGGAPHSKNGVRCDVDDSSLVKLKVYDCYFHDYTEQFIKGYYKTIVDTLIVENSVFRNAEREGLLMYESSGNGPGVNYALIQNCTFSLVGREAIKFEDNDPEILINHCTFDSTSIGTGQNKRVIHLNGHTQAAVKNIIMTNQLGTYDSSLDLYGSSTISYSDTFNVRPIDTNDQSTIGVGMLNVDPMYTDAASGDFTLQAGSPVLGQADDGFALGDLRWDPSAQGERVIRVFAGENTLYDAVQEAEDGDILELVDDGGLYTYSLSDKIEIEKSLTIRAREGLSNKPAPYPVELR